MFQRLMSVLGYERRAITDKDPALIKMFGGGVETKSGVSVNEQTALTLPAVYAAIRVRAEALASMPLILYKRGPDYASRERAPEHSLYSVLHDAPNAIQDSFSFWETYIANLGLYGNAFAQVIRDGAGDVLELWPWFSESVEVEVERPAIRYVFMAANGRRVPMRQQDVFHVHALSLKGFEGVSPVELGREAIGLGMAAGEYGARYFGVDATPPFVFTRPGPWNEQAKKNFLKSFMEHHGGLANKYQGAVLEEGMGLEKLGNSPEESQLLGIRQYQVAESARVFGVQPHMIGDLSRATFSNIEQETLNFVTHTILPLASRIERAITRQLLRPEERGEYFAEFNLDGLVRADLITRYTTYSTAIQNGIMSANEVRQKENMNPREGGDIYLQPVNMAPSGTGPLRHVLADALTRVLRAEAREVRKLGKKHLDGTPEGRKQFLANAGDFYANGHTAVMRDALASPLEAYTRFVIPDCALTLPELLDQCVSTRGQRAVAAIAQQIDQTSLDDATALDALLDAWVDGDASRNAELNFIHSAARNGTNG
jgi:HK97 family phage portal protein